MKASELFRRIFLYLNMSENPVLKTKEKQVPNSGYYKYYVVCYKNLFVQNSSYEKVMQRNMLQLLYFYLLDIEDTSKFYVQFRNQQQ